MAGRCTEFASHAAAASKSAEEQCMQDGRSWPGRGSRDLKIVPVKMVKTTLRPPQAENGSRRPIFVELLMGLHRVRQFRGPRPRHTLL